MGCAAVEKLAIGIEMLRPELNFLGADVLENAGQTVFPQMGPNGFCEKFVVYVGALNARKDLAFNWDKIEITRELAEMGSIFPLILSAAKERAWLQ